MKKRSNKELLMAKKDVGFVIVIILIMILKKEITDISLENIEVLDIEIVILI